MSTAKLFSSSRIFTLKRNTAAAALGLALLLPVLGAVWARGIGGHGPSGGWGHRSGSFHAQTGRPYAGRSAGNFHAPSRDYQGHALTARPVSNIAARGDLVHGTLGNRAVIGNVRSVMGVRGDMDGRYHWYSAGGVRFAHWYDAPYGRHWFGFYAGNAFFWSIYWNNYFWWYEPGYARWLWYWDGNWWYYGPGGVPYVYVDNGYYTWQQEPNGEVLVPAPSEAGKAPAAEQPAYHYSGDGKRLVQVEGSARSAYLYDLTTKDADGNYQLIRFLGEGVQKVQFTNPAYGGPMQIILEIKDKSGKTTRQALDNNGNAVAGASGAGTEVPAPPQGIPNANEVPKAPESMSAPVPANVKPPAAPSGAAETGAATPLGTSPDDNGN